MEVKVETKGDSKEVKATKEGREPESRIPEVPDTSNSSSTPLSTPPPATSCYNIEDILSEIVLPPPLSPQLEDLTNFREEERRSHLACRERLAPSSCHQSLAGTESSCPMMSTSSGTQCQPSTQPHLLSSSVLQTSSYDAVVPSNTHSSPSSSFPPFDDPGDQESFGELYRGGESDVGRMSGVQCGQNSMMQQDLYCAPLSTLLCKM